MGRSGLNQNEANLISDIYAEGEFRPAEGQLRNAISQGTRFGDIQSIEKNYGGLKGLADFWDKGGKGKMTDVPLTSTPSGGKTGGNSLLLPETPLTGITPRDDLNNQLGQETYGSPEFQKLHPGAQGAMEQSPFEQGFNNAKTAMGGAGGASIPAGAKMFQVDGKAFYSPSGVGYDAIEFDPSQHGMDINSLGKGIKNATDYKGSGEGGGTPTGGLTSLQGKEMIQKYTPTQYNGAQADAVMAADKAHQKYVKDFTDFQTAEKQQETLTQEYARLTKESGIAALDTTLLNMRNIMDGTEDDIRNEVTKVGGFATNSQVLALTNARNKSMIQNYNNLLQTRENMQNNIQMMMGFSEKDRAYARDQVDRQLNFNEKQIQYADKMLANAQNSLENSAKQMGWSGILQAALATGDPNAVKRINSTMGGGFDLNIAAQKELQELQDSKSKPTGDIQEYKYAKEQGYKGTFQQWVDRNRKGTGSSSGGGGGGTNFGVTNKTTLQSSGGFPTLQEWTKQKLQSGTSDLDFQDYNDAAKNSAANNYKTAYEQEKKAFEANQKPSISRENMKVQLIKQYPKAAQWEVEAYLDSMYGSKDSNEEDLYS